jgi:hypothetical protein
MRKFHTLPSVNNHSKTKLSNVKAVEKLAESGSTHEETTEKPLTTG